MGCGACANTLSSVSPTQTLEGHIRQLLKNYKYNTFLTQRQCNMISNYIDYERIPNFDTYNISNISKDELLQKQILWKMLIYLPNKSFYKDNLYLQNRTVQSQKLAKQFQQISRDINRTFGNQLSQVQKHSLKNILENISIYYPTIGYTQGMNFFIGFLLLCGYKQKQSFWMFINLSRNTNFMMIMNFSSQFEMVKHMINIFQLKLKQLQPQIVQKLDHFNITSYFYSFSWFLSYFLYSFPLKCCVKIWGYLLRKGSITPIISISIEIVRALKDTILEAQSPDVILKAFRTESLTEMLDESKMQSIIEASKNIIIHDQQFYQENSTIYKIRNNYNDYQALINQYRGQISNPQQKLQ